MKLKCTAFKQNDKNYLHVNDAEIYFENLENTYNYIKNGVNLDFLNFAFVTLCSGTLESSLNHIIIEHFLKEFGPLEYKKYANGILNLGFLNKLLFVPVLISNSELCFNTQSNTIKSLEEMINLRNKLLHQKPSLLEFEHDIDDLNLGLEITFDSNNYIKQITKNKCNNFYKALQSFKIDFMLPYLNNELKSNNLLIKK